MLPYSDLVMSTILIVPGFKLVLSTFNESSSFNGIRFKSPLNGADFNWMYDVNVGSTDSISSESENPYANVVDISTEACPVNTIKLLIMFILFILLN